MEWHKQTEITRRLKDGLTQGGRDDRKTERWSDTSKQRLQED